MSSVIEHIEKYCGEIVEGWDKNPEGERVPFQIVRTSRGAVKNSITYATLGLSNIPLISTASGKSIRQELVMLARCGQEPKNIGPLLQQVAIESVARKSAYLRGEVIGPRGELFAGSRLTALYVSIPVYFSDSFGMVTAKDVGSVIFSWLIPISTQEFEYIKNKGWSAFETELVRVDPDLLDISRESIFS